MDTKGNITAELVGALDKKEKQIKDAIIVYSLKSPEERILSARDAFLGFEDSAQPGSNIKTSVPVADRPGIDIEARIEFPMVQISSDNSNADDRYNTHESKWNNTLVIKARATDGIPKHTQPNFTKLGVVEFNGTEPAVLHNGKAHIKFGDPGSEEVLEIIDSAVKQIFEKNELVRKKMGRDVLARRWEQTSSEVPIIKPRILSRLKNLIGNRPE